MTDHSEIDAILERARAYRHEVSARLGHPPETFLVTEDESRVLFWMWHATVWPIVPDPDPSLPDMELSLFGMRVVQPERLPWFHEHPFMEHFKRSPLAGEPVSFLQPFESLPDALTRCRTERPPSPRRTITCPCGEVIWELPSTLCGVPRVIEGTFGPELWRIVGHTPPEDGTLSALISAKEPSPSTVADSERSSFEEWSARVDALLREGTQVDE